MKKSILENIKNRVNEIQWDSDTLRNKAISLCISIYGIYSNNGGDFNHYHSFSKEYFRQMVGKSTYAILIKNKLIENGVLEPHKSGSYDVYKNKAKGYRFNQELINGEYDVVPCGSLYKDDVVPCGSLNMEKLSQINNNLLILKSKAVDYHICGSLYETLINNRFERLSFKSEVNDWINEFKLNLDDIKVNDDIEEEFINLKLENDRWRVSIQKAIELSKEQGKDLILYNKTGYIENLDEFIDRKERELKLIFKKSVFEVENNIFRINRNDTNRRLDYNLTNMKSKLLDFLEIDGERLIELDIANAQFAILSYITEDLDKHFIEKSQAGTLYNGNKEKWFRIAFDKIKKEQDEFRNEYPKTMKFIDEYKSKWGYKSFSNLLQNVESLVMIDGLLPNIIEKWDVFPIHDAIRVKESQMEEVKLEIIKYFNEIGFKCLVRDKRNSKVVKVEMEKIDYKGIRIVEIEKVTIEDKRLFISKINEVKDIYGDVLESHIQEMNLWSKEKTWYLYNKWRNKNEYTEITK